MISITAHSGIYTLLVKQQLNMPLEEAWNFFSSPNNLSKITPSDLGFEITSGPTKKMHTGQIISYKVSPILGIKMYWVTEITHIEKQQFFIDEQRFGPYAMWHHEHHFEENEKGVLMTDKVSYKLPVGILGRIFHPIIVEPQLKKIFGYRIEVLDKMFNEHKIVTPKPNLQT